MGRPPAPGVAVGVSVTPWWSMVSPGRAGAANAGSEAAGLLGMGLGWGWGLVATLVRGCMGRGGAGCLLVWFVLRPALL